MQKEIPKFDLPLDYIITDDISGDILNQYGRFPCKIKAGLFILCTQGSARATINLEEYAVKANDFITLIPDTFIQIHEVSDDIKFYVAGFSSNFISHFNLIVVSHQLQPILLEHPVISLSPAHVPTFVTIYKAFICAYDLQQTSNNKEIIKAILSLFTQSVCEIYKSHCKWELAPVTREALIYRNFIQLVMKNYRTEHGVAFYAGQLHLSLPYFCNSIKQAAGRTARDIINATLIMDAQAQLRTTDLSVKAVAFMLGFENAAFFSKYFKKYTGMTPQEYKKG